jgi:hypothetical protein
MKKFTWYNPTNPGVRPTNRGELRKSTDVLSSAAFTEGAAFGR